MTMQNRIARPYARAAFAVARESDKVAQWSAALKVTAEAMSEPAVQAWLKNPKTASLSVVELIISLKPEVFEGQVKTFIELLAQRGRLLVACGISELFEAY